MRALTLTALILTTGYVWASSVTPRTQPAAAARATVQQQGPRGVAEQIDRRDTGKDSRLEMTMRLFDRQGRVRERTLTVTTLRGAGTRGDRVLTRFSAPGDIKGTGFLVWEHPQADDERFLYLPALARVRRIAGAETQDSFVGSDLSYEDIGGRELDDYKYVFADPNASWTAPDGQTHPAWALEARASNPEVSFPRSVSLVRKDNFVIVSSDVFNRRDELAKRYQVRRLDRIDGIWTVLALEMANLAQGTRTELTVTSARYNIGLADSDFSRRALEQTVR